MNRTERHEEHQIEAALDNAYDSNFNPDLKIHLGGTAIGGSDDYFTKTVPDMNVNQLRLFEGESDGNI